MVVEPLREPVPVFLTIMAVVLVTPLLSQRLHLPGIVGLIVGGILVGPNGLGLLRLGSVIELLGTVGLVYLMFAAGLEIDLRQFGRVRNKSLVFGLLTFSVPMLFVIPLARVLGFGWASAILLGSTFASHTLIAYPILSRLGVVRNEAIAVLIGATIFTDVAALLVLAVVASAQGGEVSLLSIVMLMGLMVSYTLLILFGLPRAGKFFFRRFSSRDIEFQFVLVALFVAALGADLIGMHAIVGAFLAGLAINGALPGRSAVGSQVLFLGQSFFIPVFLIFVGMNIDPIAFVTSRQALLFGVAFTVAVYVTKFIAAWVTSRIYHYARNELLTFWGLSQAQAAATLATILVGVELELFSVAVFNAAILTVLCTCITSPLLVARFGPRLQRIEAPQQTKPLFKRILVPLANPQTQEHLLTLAEILSRAGEGRLLPLHVAQEVEGRIEGLGHQQRLLERVPEILQDPDGEIELVRRVDTSIARGILHAAIETEASLIVMGWRGKPTLRQSIFGAELDQVIWHAPVPVLVGRIAAPINATRRVILVLPSYSLSFGLVGVTLNMATAVARAVNVPLLILAAPAFGSILKERLGKLKLDVPYKTSLLGRDVVADVMREAGKHDLVLVTTIGSEQRFRWSLGHIPERLADELPGSMVVVHYPPSPHGTNEVA